MFKGVLFLLAEAYIWDFRRSVIAENSVALSLPNQLVLRPIKSAIVFPTIIYLLFCSFCRTSVHHSNVNFFFFGNYSFTFCRLGADVHDDPRFLSARQLLLFSMTPTSSLLSFPPWLEFLPCPLGCSDLNIFYLTAFVKANIQQLWSIAELQFLGSRRDSDTGRNGHNCCLKKEKKGKEKSPHWKEENGRGVGWGGILTSGL